MNLADREPKTCASSSGELAQALNLLRAVGRVESKRGNISYERSLYDDLRTAEGILEASQDLTRRINAMMPLVDGRAPVKCVLFEEFMLQ